MFNNRHYYLSELRIISVMVLGILAGFYLFSAPVQAADEIIVNGKALKIKDSHNPASIILTENGFLSFIHHPETTLRLGKVVLSGHGAGFDFSEADYRQVTIALLVAERSGRFILKADYSTGKADYVIIEDSIDDNPEQIIEVSLQSAAGLGTAESIPLVLDKSKKLIFILAAGQEFIKMGDFRYKLVPTVDENGVNWALTKAWS